jgi:peptidoglycan hydrolase-like protein with peptidoglycan-binding domain
MTGRRWRTVGYGAAALATGAAVAATLGLGGRGADEPAPPRTGPASTVPITRQTLVEAVTLAGQLGYGEETPLAAAAPGTVTWLPEVGATVRRGGVLLRADERPVLLLYGEVPMYRALAEGAQGTDVRQLERNLSALGYGGFTVDDEFSATTTGAVKRWQEDLGLPETGTVDRHRVVFTPGAVRVARRLVRPGAPATGDVIAYTGRTRTVTVPATRREAAWAAPGTRVTVELAGGASTRGRVTAVGPPAAAGTGEPTAGGDEAAPVDDAIVITVGVPDQAALGRSGTGPVSVRYVARQRADVLTVPVNALLALAEGGYGLEVVSGGTATVVAVEVGMFADGRVEVTGPGLAEGASVGVPS